MFKNCIKFTYFSKKLVEFLPIFDAIWAHPSPFIAFYNNRAIGKVARRIRQ